jgi:hypothetical protein
MGYLKISFVHLLFYKYPIVHIIKGIIYGIFFGGQDDHHSGRICPWVL